MRIVVISATSVIAKSCIYAWATGGSHEFVLVGRSLDRLKAVRNDLKIRFPNSNFEFHVLDLQNVSAVSDLLKVI